MFVKTFIKIYYKIVVYGQYKQLDKKNCGCEKSGLAMKGGAEEGAEG